MRVVLAGFRNPVRWPATRSAAAPPPLELTAEQDHKMMMEQLGIASIRPGANGRDPNRAERG